MGYLRGLAKAVLVYLAVAGALALTFSLEIGVFIVGMLTGHFGSAASSIGAWLAIFLLLLCTLVFLQRHLPQRVKDAIHLHQLSLDGAPAPVEQLIVRAILLVAYVTVAMTQASTFEAMFARETLAVSYFLICLPAVQAIVAKGRYSLIDYALFARASLTTAESSQEVDSRYAQVVLSAAVAALMAFMAAGFGKDYTWLSDLSSWRKSNPAFFTATLFGVYDNQDAKSESPEVTAPEVRGRIESALAAADMKVLRVEAAGATTLESGEGATGSTIDVDDSIDIQVALPALTSEGIKAAFQNAADRVCKAEMQARPAGKRLAVRLRVFGHLDIFEFEVQKPYVCSDAMPAKGALGAMNVGFSFSMISSGN
jgi:hypothetical protein